MWTTELAAVLITGITGQDGSCLAELVLGKGYEVHGVVGRRSSLARSRIDHLEHVAPSVRGPIGFRLHYGDRTDAGSVQRLVRAANPDEVYPLAGQRHVGGSVEEPEYAADADGLGTTRRLQALRNVESPVRSCHASTSELFGATPPHQNEDASFRPRSPYAVAELYPDCMTVTYCEAHGMFACNGILFNHQSPRRGKKAVPRKTTRGVAACLKTGTRLRLGSLEARGHCGHARDYVQGMWLMLQQPTPSDYETGTGISRPVRDMVEFAVGLVGLDWRDHVDLDPAHVRPTAGPELLADLTKANQELGWYPRTSFDVMIREMLVSDLRAVSLDADEHVKAVPMHEPDVPKTIPVPSPSTGVQREGAPGSRLAERPR